MSYLKRHGTRRVPQRAPIPGSVQVPNSAGGYGWEVDDWARLRRFLILGSEGGSYYASEWTALLEDMPAGALIRNLATMTRVGVIAPGSDGTVKAVAQLSDRERIRKARVHPIALLAALRTYGAGRGGRGRGEWNPAREVVDALDAAFYTAFENVEPTGERLLLALDVSASMMAGWVAGIPRLTTRSRRSRACRSAVLTARCRCSTRRRWRRRSTRS
jgi:hypothetical protein